MEVDLDFLADLLIVIVCVASEMGGGVWGVGRLPTSVLAWEWEVKKKQSKESVVGNRTAEGRRYREVASGQGQLLLLPNTPGMQDPEEGNQTEERRRKNSHEGCGAGGHYLISLVVKTKLKGFCESQRKVNQNGKTIVNKMWIYMGCISPQTNLLVFLPAHFWWKSSSEDTLEKEVFEANRWNVQNWGRNPTPPPSGNW